MKSKVNFEYPYNVAAASILRSYFVKNVIATAASGSKDYKSLGKIITPECFKDFSAKDYYLSRAVSTGVAEIPSERKFSPMDYLKGLYLLKEGQDENGKSLLETYKEEHSNDLDFSETLYTIKEMSRPGMDGEVLAKTVSAAFDAFKYIENACEVKGQEVSSKEALSLQTNIETFGIGGLSHFENAGLLFSIYNSGYLKEAFECAGSAIAGEEKFVASNWASLHALTQQQGDEGAAQ